MDGPRILNLASLQPSNSSSTRLSGCRSTALGGGLVLEVVNEKKTECKKTLRSSIDRIRDFLQPGKSAVTGADAFNSFPLPHSVVCRLFSFLFFFAHICPSETYESLPRRECTRPIEFFAFKARLQRDPLPIKSIFNPFSRRINNGRTQRTHALEAGCFRFLQKDFPHVWREGSIPSRSFLAACRVSRT